MSSRYSAHGDEAAFEPGSRARVLRNKLRIRRVGDMQHAESRALDAVQAWAVDHFDMGHRCTANDVRELHRRWLGSIYTWAGNYRQVNVAKGGFQFASALQVPRLMAEFSRHELAEETPCAGMDESRLARALARTHSELVLIHPFRDGNGRGARLLAGLMALQAGMPPLDFSAFDGRGRRRYVAAIQAALDSNYMPLEALFARVFKRTWAVAQSGH